MIDILIVTTLSVGFILCLFFTWKGRIERFSGGKARAPDAPDESDERLASLIERKKRENQ
jgi:hypothetical protein